MRYVRCQKRGMSIKASEKQIAILKKYRVNYNPNITVSEASVVISALFKTERMVRKTNGMTYRANSHYGSRDKKYKKRY